MRRHRNAAAAAAQPVQPAPWRRGRPRVNPVDAPDEVVHEVAIEARPVARRRGRPRRIVATEPVQEEISVVEDGIVAADENAIGVAAVEEAIEEAANEHLVNGEAAVIEGAGIVEVAATIEIDVEDPVQPLEEPAIKRRKTRRGKSK